MRHFFSLLRYPWSRRAARRLARHVSTREQLEIGRLRLELACAHADRERYANLVREMQSKLAAVLARGQGPMEPRR